MQIQFAMCRFRVHLFTLRDRQSLRLKIRFRQPVEAHPRRDGRGSHKPFLQNPDAPEAPLIPVSYTHLDVYKRQPLTLM